MAVVDQAIALSHEARRRRPWAVWLSSAFLVVVVLAGLMAPWLAPYGPAEPDFLASLAGMGPDHLLGADQSGQDLLSRTMYGARTSLVGPVLILATAVAVGTPLGILAAWRGGWADALVQRSTDILLAFPGLLFAVLFIAIVGKGAGAAIIALGVAFAPAMAKLARSAARTERVQPYVAAYQLLGASGLSICLFRVLPRVLPQVLGYAVVLFGDALMGLAGLSYLGFGVQSPTPDWGLMVSEGQLALVLGAPLPALVPAAAIALTVVAVNVIGVQVADRLRGER
jgi:peptide/nickel transport system permease protein